MSGEGVTIGETIRVGADLKAKLELLARRENADAAWLAKRVLRDWLLDQAAALEAGEPVKPWNLADETGVRAV